ncbi:MAG TPA: 3'-5' exonuclease [Chloroflexota bacterium]|nr:3'-5' exonuclease [Chloroflexota bacterium]
MADVYISVDIETAGPVPGLYSMLSLGACRVDDPATAFYAELRPITDDAVPEALQVTGFDLATLARTGDDPAGAMHRFADWVADTAGRAVFVGFNASFDWSFVNWYFHRFLGDNPFGIAPIDIKSFYMGLSGVAWSETTSRRLPEKFQPRSHEGAEHNALTDARRQAEIFAGLLAAARTDTR